MSAESLDRIQSLLTQLMEQVRSDTSLAAEVARAEREFFAANPDALEQDPAARFRFQEWYLLERESEILGDAPLARMKLTDVDRDAMTESLMGVFQVVGCTPEEYTVEDLQDGEIHGMQRIDGVEFAAGDVLIGRLFLGPLDEYIASRSLCCQRAASALAMAFRRDVASLEIDRRLTQAEIEYLLFRSRGSGESALPEDIPLERIEAELETCLQRGGAEEYSATGISDALQLVARPGMVANPLLEKLAFDSDVDLQLVQRLMLQIWKWHQTHDRSRVLPSPGHSEASHAAPDHGESSSMEAADSGESGPTQAPTFELGARAEPDGRQPPAGAPHAGFDAGPEESAESEASNEIVPGLGADIAKRIESGLQQRKNLAEVFAEVERLVGAEPDPNFDPSSVDLSAPVEGAADAAAKSGESGPTADGNAPDGNAPDDDAANNDDVPAFDGDLRPLITEYLWEAKPLGTDSDVLEQLVLTQCEAAVPRLNLESVTSLDLLRLLLHTYLASLPGTRCDAVGTAFAALTRFYGWVEETQCYELAATLDTVRVGLVEQVPRLDAAGLALSNAPASEFVASEAGPADSAGDRGLNRVVHVAEEFMDVAPNDSNNLVRIDIDSAVGENLREDDLLLGSLRIAEGRRGTFAGMVVAIPAIAQDLLG